MIGKAKITSEQAAEFDPTLESPRVQKAFAKLRSELALLELERDALVAKCAAYRQIVGCIAAHDVNSDGYASGPSISFWQDLYSAATLAIREDRENAT